uniref:Uncharacterized protein n=1 Tax=Tetranychus urticae TaxID=32264 RepID=T1KRR5_TETUR
MLVSRFSIKSVTSPLTCKLCHRSFRLSVPNAYLPSLAQISTRNVDRSSNFNKLTIISKTRQYCNREVDENLPQPAYSRFADQYRLKAEELKKNLSKTTRLDKLFELIYDNIDYVGRINSGVFISRLSHLTDPREKNHKKLTLKQIDFLTKLVLVNVNVLADANLLSLVAIILSQKLSDDHKLTTTTLHEIRCRLKDFEVTNLIWLWKQSGFRMKSSEKSKEWRLLREEIINVVEKKVENFHYDFQNVTEISQLSRILLTKSSSMPILNGLIKNITVFTESIDYGLAWALLVQLSSPYRRFGRIESKDLDTIYNKCFQVIQDQFYENNFQMDTYVKEFFLDRMVESPQFMKLPYNQSFFQALKKLVKRNQKYLEPKKFSKCLDFFGFNRYYPADLMQSYCTWITDHPDDYLSDPEHNPTNLVKLFSESRFFETKKDQWNNFSKLLLDPAKITCLSQIDKFQLLSYLMIMNDYSHLQSFCPEFDGLLEKMNLQRSLCRSYLHIYAGLSKEESKLNIEGQLIKKSLDNLAKRARKSSIFLDRPDNSDDYLDELLANVFRDRSLYSRRWIRMAIYTNFRVEVEIMLPF